MTYKTKLSEGDTLEVFRNSLNEFSVGMREVDTTGKLALASDDVIKFQIWEVNAAAPLIEITSAGANSNGSTMENIVRGDGSTTDATCKVKLSTVDSRTLAGGRQYNWRVGYDDISANQFELAGWGKVTTHPAPA